jgi:hypothetical protein
MCGDHHFVLKLRIPCGCAKRRDGIGSSHQLPHDPNFVKYCRVRAETAKHRDMLGFVERKS